MSKEIYLHGESDCFICLSPTCRDPFLFSEPYILDLKIQPTYTADLKDAVGLTQPIL